MNNNKIGKFITQLRKEKGLTQHQLGEKLFVTDKAVSKWERGLSLPDITILENLAQILDADVSEILNGERSKVKNNIQEEINKEISKITETQIHKKNKLKRQIKLSFIIFISLILIFLIIFKVHYDYYHPKIIKEGTNNYELGFLGRYNLQKEGLDEVIEIINKTDKKDLKINIVSLNIQLNKNGTVKQMGINLNYFNKNLEYLGHGYLRYQNKKLEYNYEGTDECKTVSECEVNRTLVEEYSKSLNLKYISDKLKKIPFKKQIKLSNLDNYIVEINSNQNFDTDTYVFDMRDDKNIKALSFKDYKKGFGGIVSSGIYLEITLSDGSSAANEIYRYIFDSIDGDIKKLDYTMETDYYINSKNNLLFTRDYGKTWINTDITSEDLISTLDFYRDISLPNSSWFISTNELIPIAYFYGETPKLKISIDNGKSWKEQDFQTSPDIYKTVPHRIVGFINQNLGYVALGSDWTMGSGEVKKAYLTENSGDNWEEITLPENNSSKTLIDFIMYDENNGVILLHNNQKEEFPYIYSTKNRGKTWKEVKYLDDIPNEVTYLSNIDKIVKEQDYYIITLSQGDNATTKVNFKSSDLINWHYLSKYKSNIHTVG